MRCQRGILPWFDRRCSCHHRSGYHTSGTLNDAGMAVASLIVGVLSLVGVLSTQAFYASVLDGV
jgi:hypothetical protein